MSLIANDELTKITSTTSGTINNRVIELAKKVLFTKISAYIIDDDELEIVRNKISNMKIELLSGDSFKEAYSKCNGKGFLPGGFEYLGVVYFRNDLEFDKNEFHKLIHEMLHAISSHLENGKIGLFQINKEKNYSYGRGINEAFTEYLTSLFLEDKFSGYSIDFYYIIQLFMTLTNLDIKDLFRLYISKDEWLTDEIISTFNPNDNELVGLIVEYDNRLNPNKNKTFNPNNVLQFLFNSIKIKINNNEKLDTEKLEELLKQYYSYYYDVDRDLEVSTKTGMAEILDILGTYKHKISR